MEADNGGIAEEVVAENTTREQRESYKVGYQKGYNNGLRQRVEEVVEWINSKVLINSYSPTLFPRTEWQAKLKEWGIEE